MSLRRVDYLAPTTLDAALVALREPGSVALAGGHHLLTRLKRHELTAGRLVDLRGVDALRGVTGTGLGGVRVGALTTLTELLVHPVLRGPGALDDALSQLGDRQSRNRVTVGGQLACGRPGNDLAAALMALGADVSLVGPAGGRFVLLADLWADRARLAPGELITAVELGSVRTGTGYARMTDRATMEAVCGVAVAVAQGPDGHVAECIVAAVGATDRPGRITAMEQALIGTDGSVPPPAPPADLPYLDDRKASADYRRYMVGVLAGRALALARTRAAVPVPG